MNCDVCHPLSLPSSVISSERYDYYFYKLKT